MTAKKTDTEKSLDKKEAESEGTQAREKLAKQDEEKPRGGDFDSRPGVQSDEVAVEGEDSRHRSGAVAVGTEADVRVPGHADIIWGSPAMPDEVRELYDRAKGDVTRYVELAQEKLKEIEGDIKKELKEHNAEAKKENARVEKEQKKQRDDAAKAREEEQKTSTADAQARIQAADAATGSDDPRKES